MVPPADRRALEEKLLEQVRATKEAYYRAAAEHKQTIEAAQTGQIAANRDGNQLLHRVAVLESEALEKYTKAIKAFADAVLRHGEFEPTFRTGGSIDCT